MILFATQGPTIQWESRTLSASSFMRAVRKAHTRGLVLLSWHFEGDQLAAQFGVKFPPYLSRIPIGRTTGE